MLNSAQVNEAKARLAAGQIDWNGLPLRRLTTPLTFDPGEIVTAYTEPSDEVHILAPFAVGGDAGWMQPQIAGGRVTVPSKRLRRFFDCRPIGWRTLSTSSGIYWSDAGQNDLDLARLTKSNDDGLVPFDGDLYAVGSRFPEVRISGEGLFIPHLEPGNHGSFIFRALPKLLFALACDLRFDYIVTPHRYEQFDSVMLLLGRDPVPQYTCRELIGTQLSALTAIDDFDAEGAFDKQTSARLSDLAQRARATTKATFPRRIFVSRELQRGFRPNYRPLLGESDLVAALRALQITPVFPETLSFVHQLACFASADCIVGPSGSGMLNSAFAAAGTKVLDLEFFAYTVRQHAKIYSSTGKHFGFAFGQAAGTDGPELFRSWRISDDLVVATLAELGVW